MQKLGQHFLKNPEIARRIAGVLRPKKGEVLLEIGPGHGELTEIVLQKNSGTPLLAIERDHALTEQLRNRFPAIRVMEGNALQIIPHLSEEIKGSYVLYGNIPYYITGFLLRTVGELKKKPSRLILMIQKEVGERLIAAPPHMNRLAASVQFWATPKILFSVPKTDFSPKPKVDSVVMELTPHDTKIDPESYYALIRVLFKQPRKTIFNNLSEDEHLAMSKGDVRSALQELAIGDSLRPQNLSIEEIMIIADIFKK